MPKRLQLIPAYGRKVENLQELESLWEAGKDFRMFMNGGFYAYCSNRDFDMMKKDFDIITLRCSNTVGTAVYEKSVFTHVLAGITSYI